MECNFLWKISRQSHNGNVNVFPVSVELAPVIEMASKKNFRNQADVAFTPHISSELL
jgi:hypothetical protein